jgi:ATP-binding cassette, subfamily B, bacterial MsbA
MKNFLKIIRYIKPYWLYASLNIVFNILSAIFGLFSYTMIIPFLSVLFHSDKLVTQPVPFEFSTSALTHNLNYVVSTSIINFGQANTLMYISLLVVTMSLLKNSFVFLANFFITPIRTGVVRDIREKIYDKTLKLSLSFYSDARKGDIISKMTSDVQEIEASIMSSLEMLFRDPITILLYIVAMFKMSTQLTLFVMVLLPISGLIIGRIGKNLRSSSYKGQKKLGILLSIIEETLGGLRIIKAFNGEGIMTKKFKNLNYLYTRITNVIMRRRYLASPMSEFLATIVLMVILWYGGSKVLGNDSTMSSEVFIFYLVTFSQIINPAKSFSTAYYSIQKGMASSDRIDTILNAEITIKDKPDAVPVNSFNQHIQYKGVSFKYETDLVLKDIDLTIEKGKTIALVGKSGSGKSTLADLLPRFIDATEGEILIDGINVKDYKITDLRNLMGIVSQESILFNDSFFNNIAFGTPNASLEAVVSAAKVANAHEFIMETKNGYYTNVGDRGNKLSGGQRQRISIARAVLKNPPILILDEATSALDTESERLVQDAILNLMKNRTSIVIAHRLSTIKNSHEICVIDDGRIAERGKHEDLIALNGIYSKLHVLQTY